MRQILVYCRRVPWVAPIAKLVLVGALAEFNFTIAQISFCPEPRPEVQIITGGCSDHLNPFNIPVAPEQPQHHDGVSQTVTFQELRHVAPKKAQKEMESAEKAFERNQQEEAIGHLKTAVQIDPGFVRARNNLAAIYIWQGNPDPAIEQLNEAIKLDPHFSVLFTNLTLGYILTRSFGDAERAARVSMDLDRTGSLPRYLLATALYYQNKFTDEALRYAERTGDEYPLAHLFAARIFIDRYDFKRAREEIGIYLSGLGHPGVFVSAAKSWLDFIAAHESKTAAMFP